MVEKPHRVAAKTIGMKWAWIGFSTWKISDLESLQKSSQSGESKAYRHSVPNFAASIVHFECLDRIPYRFTAEFRSLQTSFESKQWIVVFQSEKTGRHSAFPPVCWFGTRSPYIHSCTLLPCTLSVKNQFGKADIARSKIRKFSNASSKNFQRNLEE